MTLKFVFVFFLFISLKSIGQIDSSQYKKYQESLLVYKKIYSYGDSLKQLNHPGLIDSSIFKVADSLNKLHPYSYYLKAADLMTNFKCNDASFIFYLGQLRYRYYNSANPKYEASGDGALAASLAYELGEPINMFLKTDVNNMIEILEQSVNWYDNHDYQFYSKNKSPEKYLDQSKGIKGLIDDLEKNKEKYQSDWDNEKTEFLKNIDSTLNQNHK